jgi:hypothetical protein
MFPVRYELNFYILFRRNSVFKGLIREYKSWPSHVSATMTLSYSPDT